jgi:hypothetical protein
MLLHSGQLLQNEPSSIDHKDLLGQVDVVGIIEF